MKISSSQAQGILGGWALLLWNILKFAFFGTGWSIVMLALGLLLEGEFNMSPILLISGVVITILMVIHLLRKGRTVLLTLIGIGSAALLLFASETIPSWLKIALAVAAAVLVIIPAMGSKTKKTAAKQSYVSEKKQIYQEVLNKLPSNEQAFRAFCKEHNREELENMAVANYLTLMKKLPYRQTLEYIHKIKPDNAYSLVSHLIKFDKNGNVMIP